jgi:hypothetical protein
MRQAGVQVRRRDAGPLRWITSQFPQLERTGFNALGVYSAYHVSEFVAQAFGPQHASHPYRQGHGRQGLRAIGPAVDRAGTERKLYRDRSQAHGADGITASRDDAISKWPIVADLGQSFDYSVDKSAIIQCCSLFAFPGAIAKGVEGIDLCPA